MANRSGKTHRYNCMRGRSAFQNAYIQAFWSWRWGANKQQDKVFDKYNLDFMTGYDVQYSLNKRNRWDLIPKLLEKISAEEDDPKMPARVTYTETVLGQPDKCTEFASNKGPIRHKVGKERYLNTGSIARMSELAADLAFGRVSRAEYDTAEHRESNDDNDPFMEHLNFVCEIGYTSKIRKPLSSEVPSAKKSLSKNRQRYRQELIEMNAGSDDEDYWLGQISANVSRQQSIVDSTHQFRIDCDLADFIVDSSASAVDHSVTGVNGDGAPIDTGEKPAAATGGASSILHSDDLPAISPIDLEDSYPEIEEVLGLGRVSGLEATSATVELIQPVLVAALCRIKSDSVKPKTLLSTFGDRYFECGCFPRRFLICTTELVGSILMEGEKAGEKGGDKVDTESYLVVTVLNSIDLMNCEETDVDCTELRVELNLNVKLKEIYLTTINLETIYESMDQLIALSIPPFVENLSADVFNIEPSVKLTQTFLQHVVSTELVDELNQWDICTETVSDLSKKSFLKSEEGERMLLKRELSRLEAALGGGPVELTTFCEICYADIGAFDYSKRTTDEGEELVGGSCLECAHWFCNECWSSHCVEQIKAGRSRISCPALDCDQTIDSVTLLSFVPLRYFRRFQQAFSVSALARKRSAWQWCPTPDCGHILRQSSTAGVVEKCPVNVRCVCGASFCLLCLKEPHWPATCEQYVKYTEVLSKNGELVPCYKPWDNLIDSVRGKPCPKCKCFVQKLDGCKHMSCPCSHEFCWLCGNDFFGYNHPLPCQPTYDFQDHLLEFVDSRHFGGLQNYPMAVACRMQQITQMRHDFNALARKFVGSVRLSTALSARKQQRKKRSDRLDLDALQQSVAEHKAVSEFVHWMVSFVEQLWRICEYTIVFSHCDFSTVDTPEPTFRSNCLQVVDQLQFTIRRIEMIFESANSSNQRRVNNWPEVRQKLWQLRHDAGHRLKFLVRLARAYYTSLDR